MIVLKLFFCGISFCPSGGIRRSIRHAKILKEEHNMKMRRSLALILALVMAFALCACGGTTNTEAPATDAPATDAPATNAPTGSGVELKFVTGGDQGTYYGFGSVLAQSVTSSTGTRVTAVVSNGSQDNIEQMDMNTAQMGFVQSDVMSYAYNGERLFEGMPVTGFSTVAALYMEQVQIVTLDPEIKSVADLAGKRVSIGSSGSGVYYNALDVLGAYGLTEADITPTFQSFGDSVDALQDGKIDAAFVVAGAPTVAVTTLATTQDVYLVGLDAEHIAILQESSPYYSENVIAADVYGTDADCTTVAIAAVVIARDDVSEDDVYNFVSTIFENTDTIAAAHDKGNELDLEFAASITNIPYHPGAARYFAEKGIEVPTK